VRARDLLLEARNAPAEYEDVPAVLADFLDGFFAGFVRL
jgi:hypothetical protein